MKEKRKKYLWPVLIAAVMFFFSAKGGKLFAQQDLKNVLRVLIDAFFISGVCDLCLGVLSWTRKKGAFDVLSFSAGTFGGLFSERLREKTGNSFYDYTKTKEQKRNWNPVFLKLGGILFGLSLLLFLWYMLI